MQGKTFPNIPNTFYLRNEAPVTFTLLRNKIKGASVEFLPCQSFCLRFIHYSPYMGELNFTFFTSPLLTYLLSDLLTYLLIYLIHGAESFLRC